MIPADIRERYVQEIRRNSNITSPALLEAFARVPREKYAGPGPWTVVLLEPGQFRPQITTVTDPGELYRDAAIMLDQSRSLTNGNPGTLGPWLDALRLSPGKSVFHLGCGTGYYTAIMAEMVGPGGHVTALEIDPALAAQARSNLECYPNVEVLQADGGAMDSGPRDAILINAGVTHPKPSWLDQLQPGGTLVLPLTFEFGTPHISKGLVLEISKRESGFAAHFFSNPVMITPARAFATPNSVTSWRSRSDRGHSALSIPCAATSTHQNRNAGCTLSRCVCRSARCLNQ